MKIQEIMNLVNNFGNGLTKSKYDMYIPKIRDYFVPYLIKKKSESDLENVLKYEITRNDIIQSTLYYIEKNTNVRSKSAIDDFLIVLNRFFDEEIYINYPNQNLISIRPFTSLSKEIEKIAESRGMHLNPRQSRPEINEDQANYIINHLMNDKEETFTKMQYKLLIQFYLLYGFSFDNIKRIEVTDYHLDERKLEITYQNQPKRLLQIEIPYKLHKYIEKYIEMRNNFNFSSSFLFVTTNGGQISYNFIKGYLDKIRSDYLILNPDEKEMINSFTQTGLAKYAIIKMIRKGVNQSIISDLTGFQIDTYIYCQQKVDELLELNRNRYVNHMLRDMSLYDQFN
ncbi:tyrosine-type recombinase/integrase [Paenibacillus septentrionalis]|uniref:Tyrosine-type recombinase/integrase n=1 Tax=Paenibacillus septentrionalis TaxID=429342 RepID=A0ABW1UZE4_9BACL